MTYEGNCRLGDLFTSRREKGRAGLPTLSVTLNDGLVNREDLDRKQETSLAPEEHLLVKSGDIAYNMMRMWQGAFGLATIEGIVSPAYVVLQPLRALDSHYASHLFRSARMRYLFWAYSYGLTDDRLRLYFQDFSRIPVNIPNLVAQKKVAEILSTWDAATAVVTRLIDVSRREATQLTRRLIAKAERREAHWREFAFSDLFVTANSKPAQIDQSQYLLEGRIPVVDQGKDLVVGYVNDAPNPLPPNAIVFGDHTRAVKWIDFPFLPGADGTQILRARECVVAKFGYYLLKSIELPNLGYSRHMKELRKCRFSIPQSLGEQKKIVDVLDVAELRIENYQQQLRTLQAQRQALIQRLFVGKSRARIPATEAEASPL